MNDTISFAFNENVPSMLVDSHMEFFRNFSQLSTCLYLVRNEFQSIFLLILKNFNLWNKNDLPPAVVWPTRRFSKLNVNDFVYPPEK
jgi:hypothetical protein